MGLKESGYLNNIDGYKEKPNLLCTFYENTNDTYSRYIKSFDIVDRLEQ